MRLGPPSWLVLDLTELPIYPGIIIPAHIARAFPTVLEESGEFIKKFPRGRASGEAVRARARENLNSMFKIGISYKTSCRGYI